MCDDAYRNKNLLDKCGAVQMCLRSRKNLSNLGMLGKGEIIMSIILLKEFMFIDKP